MVCVALIGGMDRLGSNYISEAENLGINFIVFTKYKKEMATKIKNMDAVVIFTNKISHNAKKEALRLSKFNKIQSLMHHSCGICTWRDCFSCLNNKKGGRNNA